MVDSKIALPSFLSADKMPRHIAIIMDGNGRWAQNRGLPRTAGHRAGMEALHGIVECCVHWQVEVLTVYAFSTENWKRPRKEIECLMNLLVEYMHKELQALYDQNIQIRPIGNWTALPKKAYEVSKEAKEYTKNNTWMLFNLAVNYGGRLEIVEACKKITNACLAGQVTMQEITEDLFASYLDTGGQPDPDLLIRTAGEMRLSNFLLWQSAYTEFYRTDIFWPDFTGDHLAQAIYEYQNRKRRFGGLKQEQEE